REVRQRRYYRCEVPRCGLNRAIAGACGISQHLLKASGVEIQIVETLKIIRAANAVGHDGGAAARLIGAARVPVSGTPAGGAIECVPRVQLMGELMCRA